MEAAAPPPPPPSPASAARPIDAGRVISETFAIFGRQFVPLVGVAFIVYFVVAAVAGLLDSAESWILSLLATALRLAAAAVYTGFVVKLVQDVRDGRRDFSIGELFSAAVPAIGALIVNGILWGIGVAIGLALLIVPGLILLTIWSVCAPSIVVERRGPVEAFGRSWELVRGHGWTVFGALLLVWLILAAAFVVTVLLGVATGWWLLLILGAILSALTAPIFAIAVSVIFFDLGGGQTATAAPAAPAGPPPPPAPAA